MPSAGHRLLLSEIMATTSSDHVHISVASKPPPASGSGIRCPLAHLIHCIAGICWRAWDCPEIGGITPLRQRQAQAGSRLKQHRSPAKTAPDQRTSAGDHGSVISLPPLSPNLWTVPIPVIPPRWTGSRKRTRGRQCRMAGWDGLATVSFRTGCAYVGHFVLRHNLTPGATSKSVAYAMPTSSMETLISRLGVDNT